MTVTTDSSLNFPDPSTDGEFNVVVTSATGVTMPNPDNSEIVRVTAITGDSWTIEREQEGTTAKDIAIGWSVYISPTKKWYDDIESEFNDYVKVDQTTPQTFTSGIPKLESTRSIDQNNELADKLYVDIAVSSLGMRIFALDDVDGDTGYYLTSMDASSSATVTITKEGASDDDLIATWISPVGASFTKLVEGIYNFQMYVARTAGNKTVKVYWKLIEYKADTTEVVIATSPSSNEITTKRKVDIFCNLTTDYVPAVDSRIIGKVYADISGTGTSTNVALYIEGDEDSHWELPTDTEILDTLYAPLTHTHTESDITDLGTYLEDITGESIGDLSDVGDATATDGNVLVGDGDSWESRALTEADISDLGSYMENPMTTAGDIVIGGASGAATRLGIGTDAQVLTVASGAPSWADAAAGGGGPRGFTYVIAASNSRDNTGADAVCDGTADNVEIQAGINAVNAANGGTVMLLDGTYDIDAAMNPKANVTVMGQGYGTYILHGDSSQIFNDSAAADNFAIKNCRFNGGDTNKYLFVCNEYSNDNFEFSGNYVYGYLNGNGCFLGNTSLTYNWNIHDNVFEKCGTICMSIGNGLRFTNNSHNYNTAIAGANSTSVITGGKYCVIADNYFNATNFNSTTFFQLDDYSVISNNRIVNLATPYLTYKSEGNIVVSNNHIEGNSTALLNLGNYWVVNGNTFKQTNSSNKCVYIDGAYGSSVVNNHFEGGYCVYMAGSPRLNVITGNTAWNSRDEPWYILAGALNICNIVKNNSDEKIAPTQDMVQVYSVDAISAGVGAVVIGTYTAAGLKIDETTTASDSRVLGVLLSGGGSADAYSIVQTEGKTTALKVDGTTDIAIGDPLTTSTTAGIAVKAAAGDVVFAYAMEAYSTDDANGVIDAYIVTPRQIPD